MHAALLSDVFGTTLRLLTSEATTYVRTDARAATLNATAEVMRAQWPGWRLLARYERVVRPQTAHYGDHSPKLGEVDLLLAPDYTGRSKGFAKWAWSLQFPPQASASYRIKATTPMRLDPAGRGPCRGRGTLDNNDAVKECVFEVAWVLERHAP